MARFAGAPEILIARDMRESGVALSEAFSDGVRSEGVAVTDLGMASTDFLYFAAGRLDAPGAMSVSYTHLDVYKRQASTTSASSRCGSSPSTSWPGGASPPPSPAPSMCGLP